MLKKWQPMSIIAVLTRLFLVATAFLVGFTAHSARADSPLTSLEAERSAGTLADQIVPFSHHSDDASKIQRLSAALLALPLAPAGVRHCPKQYGVTYHLTFYAGSTPALRADAELDGCQLVRIDEVGAHQIETRRVVSDDFWALLADTLGLPHVQVYPIFAITHPSSTAGNA
jgi:hypothetical protein